MSWIRLDDRFPTHRKALAVGPLGRDLFVCGLCYCSAHLTDGFIPESAILTLWPLGDLKQIPSSLLPGRPSKRPFTDRLAAVERTVRGLLAAGLWHAEQGGYRVHDYHDWNRTREQVERFKDAKRHAGRIGGRRSAEAKAKQGAQAKREHSAEANVKQPGCIVDNPSTYTYTPPISPQAAASNTATEDPRSPTGQFPAACFRTDCPDPAWRGRCVDQAYADTHPGRYPVQFSTGQPNQCPIHRPMPQTGSSWP